MNTTGSNTRIPAATLQQWVGDVLVAVGLLADDAEIVAHVLVDADVTGKGTHGVSRLPLYVERIERGLIAAVPEIRDENPSASSVMRIDGGNGLGPLVAWRAMERAVAVAERDGMAAVAVYRSNHCGAMSAFCTAAADRGMILLALTNSPPGIAPTGGRKAFLGTNPIAWGFPRGPGRAPLVIDLATSVVARGNIIQAARLNQPIPLGWAIDPDGRPTTDATQALAGAVLPMAGAKGYALALAVEILTGVLTGAGVGPEVRNPYTDYSGPSNVGHFFLALDPERLLPAAGFYDRMDTLEASLRETPAAVDGPVSLPGDRSEAVRSEYLRDGIPLDPALIAQLNELGKRAGARGLM